MAFGASTAFVLAAIKTAFPLAPSIIFIVAAAKSLMWTAAAVVTLVCLVRSSTPNATEQ
jgi:hypothetical protein